MLWRSVFVTHLLVILVLGCFYWGQVTGLTPALRRAEAFNVLVFSEIGYCVTTRFIKASTFHKRALVSGQTRAVGAGRSDSGVCICWPHSCERSGGVAHIRSEGVCSGGCLCISQSLRALWCCPGAAGGQQVGDLEHPGDCRTASLPDIHTR